MRNHLRTTKDWRGYKIHVLLKIGADCSLRMMRTFCATLRNFVSLAPFIQARWVDWTCWYLDSSTTTESGTLAVTVDSRCYRYPSSCYRYCSYRCSSCCSIGPQSGVFAVIVFILLFNWTSIRSSSCCYSVHLAVQLDLNPEYLLLSEFTRAAT